MAGRRREFHSAYDQCHGGLSAADAETSEEAVILQAYKVVVDVWEEVLHRRTPFVARMFGAGAFLADACFSGVCLLGVGLLRLKNECASPIESLYGRSNLDGQTT